MGRLLAILRGLAASRITTFQVLKNQLDATSVNNLCACLQERWSSVQDAQPLQHLHLDCNPIGAEGAGILAGSLLKAGAQRWCDLTTLRLGYTKLEAAGAHVS